MEKLRVGDSLDKTNDIGSIVSPTQLETIQGLVQQGIDEGGDLWQPSWACPVDGYYYPPTLFTNVSPAATISQVEIFGPVLVSSTFRTHQEAVKLANNTRYGLAASVWTENINLALDLAPKIKAGTIWINCTNLFDAASGFGGYRESGFGREGGREGLYEYLKPRLEDTFPAVPVSIKLRPSKNSSATIDRTAKLYIGGKQVRPDGGYSLPIITPNGSMVGEVGKGNRKDIRNAVEAAHAQVKWNQMTGHARAQVLYYLAENLSARTDEFISRIRSVTDAGAKDAKQEVQWSIERIYHYAAKADKYDGQVHHTVFRNVTMAMPEAIGVLGIACPDQFPLLGFISTVLPAIAVGNTTVVVPSETAPLSATDLYQVIETSDVPSGVINIVTGLQSELIPVLAAHNDVDGLWYFGDTGLSEHVETASAENMKRTWVNNGRYRDWRKSEHALGEEFLRQATQMKNIWVPYGA
jgi:aldehyde dehydrogenase (NAD+)